MMKLFIIRCILLVIFRVLKVWKPRFAWLYHYLEGSGRAKDVPKSYILAVLPTIAYIYRCGKKYGWDGDYDTSKLQKTSKGHKVLLHSTTWYKGHGFWGRPEMFYLVGCMTFNVRYLKDIVFLSGVDRYDWHQNEDGEYFTSPMPLWITKILNVIFGDEYFPISGFPMGEPGISNKLWDDLRLVGAREFETIVKLEMSSTEWRRVQRETRI